MYAHICKPSNQRVGNLPLTDNVAAGGKGFDARQLAWLTKVDRVGCHLGRETSSMRVSQDILTIYRQVGQAKKNPI